MKDQNLRRPIAIDLFAGVGGLSLGFEQAGFDVVASVELDPVHAAIHELNFPQWKVICANIKELSAKEIRAQANIDSQEIDAVIGGPPCQGFSLIGHRVLDDPRNGLVFHFLRLVMELKPRAFVMENVPGMITGQHTRLVKELIDGFQSAGYAVAFPPKILNAVNYGVPQDRRRVFIMGARRGIRTPEYPIPDTVTLPRWRAKSDGDLLLDELPFCPTVWDAIGDLPNIDSYERLFESDELKANLRKGSRYAQLLSCQVSDDGDFSYRRRSETSVVTGCLRARHTSRSVRRFSATVPGNTEPVSRFFKLSKEGVCNTLRAGTAADRGAFSAPRPIHPVHPRCISVREAARIHSFPDWFRFHQTIWHGFRQIGNSVPPLLGRAVAASVMAALGKEPLKPKAIVALGPNELASLSMRESAAHFGVSAEVIPSRRRQSVAAD